MKISAFICWIVFSGVVSPPLLVVDMDSKRPPAPATEFTAEQYFGRSFPIYLADRYRVIEAIEKAAKIINRWPPCDRVDTLTANHTLVIVKTNCDDGRSFSARLVTQSRQPDFLYDFQLVRKEKDARKAQATLLDFATYLLQ
ncbi:MAG TPA: hypothetical protein VM871_02965 [Flavisolibacter sp.]|jgi:hypothetical protein|nr:hypothetical protein [Flavisolibacter sp.]